MNGCRVPRVKHPPMRPENSSTASHVIRAAAARLSAHDRARQGAIWAALSGCLSHRHWHIKSAQMAGVTGLEPAASGVTGQRSNQLSYTPETGQNHRPSAVPVYGTRPAKSRKPGQNARAAFSRHLSAYGHRRIPHLTAGSHAQKKHIYTTIRWKFSAVVIVGPHWVRNRQQSSRICLRHSGLAMEHRVIPA